VEPYIFSGVPRGHSDVNRALGNEPRALNDVLNTTVMYLGH
jgi:hypothetical protein